MLIDSHVHIYPDAIAARAIANMEQHAGYKMATDGTLSALKKSMEISGITHAVTLPVSTRPGQVASINRYALSLLKEKTIIPFGNIDPRVPDFKDELKRLRDGGIKGVKMHPDHQDFYVDDESVFPVYEAIADNGLILYLHAGRNIDLPEPVHCSPRRLATLLRRMPSLLTVAAHMGGWRMWDEVEPSLVGIPNLWLDTSFAAGYIEEERFLRIIRRHGIERIFFGTDSPWLNQAKALADFKRIALSAEEKEAILWNNACKFLHLKH